MDFNFFISQLKENDIEIIDDNQGFICPFCEEPVYFEDFEDFLIEDFFNVSHICPVCEEHLF